MNLSESATDEQTTQSSTGYVLTTGYPMSSNRIYPRHRIACVVCQLLDGVAHQSTLDFSAAVHGLNTNPLQARQLIEIARQSRTPACTPNAHPQRKAGGKGEPRG